jgi:hypothetical protein
VHTSQAPETRSDSVSVKRAPCLGPLLLALREPPISPAAQVLACKPMQRLPVPAMTPY